MAKHIEGAMIMRVLNLEEMSEVSGGRGCGGSWSKRHRKGCYGKGSGKSSGKSSGKCWGKGSGKDSGKGSGRCNPAPVCAPEEIPEVP
jgi:hypothetical protein